MQQFLQPWVRYLLIAVVGTALYGCSNDWKYVQFEAVRVFPALTFSHPVLMVQAPGHADRWYVVERAGRVLYFQNTPGVTTTSQAIDISSAIDASGEGGLLGMAFHPNFAINGYVYLSYTAPSGTAALETRISRFTSSDGGLTLDSGTELIILQLDQPYTNHNGGHIVFGPDGYLYIGLGDGGSGGDPLGNGQNINTLLGALLRIDVDSGTPYAIPADNPFYGGGGRGEIYAWGLRNPWRFSFDRDSGGLWAGDVGQESYEEIDHIRRGRNYGWNIREGAHCYISAYCSTAGLTDPEVDYDHTLGCSVTGGYVYGGSAIPSLYGVYVFGDFCSGRIWGFDVWPYSSVDELVNTDLAIVSFAETYDGELLIIDYNGGIYQLQDVGS